MQATLDDDLPPPANLLERAERLMLRLGLVRGTALVTGISLALSLACTWASFKLPGTTCLDHGIAYLIAGGVPLIVAPLMSGLAINAMLRLDAARAQMRHLAHTDSLTQAYNRRHFFKAGVRAFEQARKFEMPLALILFDLDGFKGINDRHGHQAGDAYLQAVASCCMGQLRAGDIFARSGGEEFVLLLPGATQTEAEALARRLRILIESTRTLGRNGEVRTTASFGVAEISPHTASLEELMELADAAAYRAKDAGRNRVCSAPPARAAGPREALRTA